VSIIQLTGSGGEWPATPAPDPYAANLVLALPMNVGYGIRDASAKIRGTGSGYRMATVAGSIDTAASKYYGSSFAGGAPGGSTQRLYTATPIPSFGSGDFCIEGYAYIPSLQPQQHSFGYNHNDTNAGLQLLFLGSSNTPASALYFGGGAGADAAHTSAGSFPVGQWNHFAATRSGTTLRLFINGVNRIVSGGSITNNYSGSFQLNLFNSGGSFYNGARLQDYRIYQGVAKYTSNFTPPGPMFV
jgi:hypothetical protein